MHVMNRSHQYCISSSPLIANGFKNGPLCPILKDNPFLKVTDPFCRLPLPILSHRIEVVLLGDLIEL
ncbi:hypothetical protein KSP39_PZI014050 [Platanthera zijinensis]|uniref:Uncharacterized protein n=1 Tax=Platanthera zijinensis TaxID=2320716 RepID=A0AAP0G348_9ASPA